MKKYKWQKEGMSAEVWNIEAQDPSKKMKRTSDLLDWCKLGSVNSSNIRFDLGIEALRIVSW